MDGDTNILRLIRVWLLCKTGLWHSEYWTGTNKKQKYCSVCHTWLNKPKHLMFPFSTADNILNTDSDK